MQTFREWWSLDRRGVLLLALLVAMIVANAACYAWAHNPINLMSGVFVGACFGYSFALERATIASLRRIAEIRARFPS